MFRCQVLINKNKIDFIPKEARELYLEFCKNNVGLQATLTIEVGCKPQITKSLVAEINMRELKKRKK